VSLVAALMLPSPEEYVGGVRPQSPSVAHIAVGLWAATIAVLVLPHPRRRHQVSEDHLLRAHSIAMTSFALL